MKYGILFRLRSWWIGVHWSPKNKRVCINPVPMVTFWFTFEGGITPNNEKQTDQIALRAARDIMDLFPDNNTNAHKAKTWLIQERVKQAMQYR